MGFFARRRTLLAQAIAEAVAEAVVKRLPTAPPTSAADVADVGAKMLGSMTGFLTGASDLALRGAASALGQRGGRRTQERRRGRVALPPISSRPTCRLCRDSHTRNLSVEEIQEHRRHEHSTDPAPARIDDPAGDQRNSAGLWGQQRIGPSYADSNGNRSEDSPASDPS
jgi:hypothetical protein